MNKLDQKVAELEQRSVQFLAEHPDLNEDSPEYVVFQQRVDKLCEKLRRASLQHEVDTTKLGIMQAMLPIHVEDFFSLCRNVRDMLNLLTTERCADHLRLAYAAPLGSAGREFVYTFEKVAGLIDRFSRVVHNVSAFSAPRRDVLRDAIVQVQAKQELDRASVQGYLDCVDELVALTEHTVRLAERSSELVNVMHEQARCARQSVA